MPAQMKGLTQFIVDLRNSKDNVEENKRINSEINHIQQKFRNNNLNGYQKKKYICKLLYICLQGNTDTIDFGLKEAFQLLDSNTFSEKQLGYLSVSLLVNYNRSIYDSPKLFMNYLMKVTFKNILKDLKSNDEDFNCLAMQFIAAKFNINESTISDISALQVKEQDENSEDWLELIEVVYSYAISPMNGELIKKKSSLALLALIKVYPDAITTNATWTPRILQLMDNKDFGVVTSSIPLIKHVVTLSPQYMKSLIPSIATKLVEIIIDGKCAEKYYYFNTPSPWLVVKLLQLVEYFFLLADPTNDDFPYLSINDLDKQTLDNLRQVVAKSIHNASQSVKGLPNRNSQSSILFQAVSLAVFLDASPDAIVGAISALMMLLDSAETNTRYLALDALIKLTARSSVTHLTLSHGKKTIDDKLPIVFHLLYDKDISVRKKALDFLYTICNPLIYTVIINKLLDLFPLADFSLKPELAIKIAVLAEKFATDSTWYVTTMLRLLSIGTGSNSNGVSYISNEVWERIVQIVVNNEDLQEKTCKLIIGLLKDPHSNSVTKGQRRGPIASGVSENLVKVASFVLGEFGHLVVDQPETSSLVQFRLLYESYFKVSLVTRAMLLSTFFKFAIKFRGQVFVADIVDLFEIESASIDLEIQTRCYEYFKLITDEKNAVLAQAIIKAIPPFATQESPLMKRISNLDHIVRAQNGRNRSKSLVMAKNIVKAGNGDHSNGDDNSDNPFEDTQEKVALTPNWYSGYHRMLHYDAGIFFENQMIKITYRTVKNGNAFSVKFTIINNSAKTAGTEITGFKVLSLRSGALKEDPNYLVMLKQPPDTNIIEKSMMEVEVKIRNVVENNESPVLTMTFNCGGSFNQLDLKIPVVCLKTLSSTSLSTVEEFKKRWEQIGELLGPVEGEYALRVGVSHRYNSSNIVRLLSRLGFSVVHSTSDEVQNGILVMGGGILHTAKTNYGVLTTIKSLDSVGKEFEITVRCTGGGIAEILAQSLREILEGKL